ncbi:hypothetical protein EDD37DRAFT_689625 [Exophiala viscosa]|uniref:uncharacterized protein n=1 Tax=Exophiala viscosa TaxID=2486360 RepID=UPI00219E867B|nr:hypothetical protein EDD37DRAFT_689625 [Exophiala viscosa]
MYTVFFAVLCCLLAETPLALAAAGPGQPASAFGNLRALLGSAAHAEFARGTVSVCLYCHRTCIGGMWLTSPRQSVSTPPTTTTAQCDEYNNYLYVTPENYTFQLQCETNYDGFEITVDDPVSSLTTCIEACVTYNVGNPKQLCKGVNFNAAFGAAFGQCTLYSEVTDLSLADEDEVQDSALLVEDPSGNMYASGQVASFSGEPTQAPSIVPLPTTAASQTTSGMSTTSTTTITTTVTSTTLITSCPAGMSGCLSSLTTPFSTSTVGPISDGTTTGNPTTTVSQPPNSASTSPSPFTSSLTTPTGTGTAGTNTTPPAGYNVDAVTTFTNIVPVTEYRVQVVEICAATSTPCSESTVTSTRVGYRTEISCSPGPCTGVMVASSLMADFAATGTCIMT